MPLSQSQCLQGQVNSRFHMFAVCWSVAPVAHCMCQVSDAKAQILEVRAPGGQWFVDVGIWIKYFHVQEGALGTRLACSRTPRRLALSLALVHRSVCAL